MRVQGDTSVEVQFGSDAKLTLQSQLLSVAPVPLLDPEVDYQSVFAKEFKTAYDLECARS